jgi:hypothetical protein
MHFGGTFRQAIASSTRLTYDASRVRLSERLYMERKNVMLVGVTCPWPEATSGIGVHHG